MQHGELNEDDVPRISEGDQATLLRRGLLIARMSATDFSPADGAR